MQSYELARELVGGQVAGPSADLLRAATVTTRSLPALKAYLEGERAYRENRLADMRVAMERAVAEDSTFALAHYRLAIAAEGAGGGLELIHRSVENAIRYPDRLSDRHRLLLDALHAYWRGNYGHAAESYRRVVLRYPDDVEGWYRLAELQFHRMPALGQPFTSARPAFERVLALEPHNAGALHHLTRIAAGEGRAAELDNLTERALVYADANQRIELAVIRAFANGSATEQARVATTAKALPFTDLHVAAVRLASYTGNVRGAEALLAPLTEPGSAPTVRVLGHLQLAEFAAAGGRWREARRRLQEAETLAPVMALAMEASLGILPFAPMTRAELLRLRHRVIAWNVAPAGVDSLTGLLRVPVPARPALRRFYIGALSLRLGDAAAATLQADDLARDSIAVSYGLPRLLRALIALSVHRPADGLVALDSLTAGDPTLGFVRQDALMRYLRAQLLHAVGRDADADGWFGSYGDLAGWDLAFLAPSEIARAGIAERRGDAAAIHHYGRALTLWKSADPELRPLVEQARSRLTQLGSVAGH
jgi:tetratricopeptide (TPR) repeat protein